MIEEQAIERIEAHLAEAGLRPGGAALVHSSLKSMRYVPGGPETVVQGLLHALGSGGTLLMPALTYLTVNADHPVFDVRGSPSCVGAVPEHFRTRPGTLRSVNPTHSVCGIGPHAEALLGTHHMDETPAGPHSPYAGLRDAGGQVVFLGCGLRPNTSMHGVEELVEPTYLFGGTMTYRVVLADGRETHMTCRCHAFKGWRQRYDRLGALLEGGELRTGRVLNAEVHVVDAQALWQKAEAALRRDPFFFVERVG